MARFALVIFLFHISEGIVLGTSEGAIYWNTRHLFLLISKWHNSLYIQYILIKSSMTQPSLSSSFVLSLFLSLQCSRRFPGGRQNESSASLQWWCYLDPSGHIQELLQDWRHLLPLRLPKLHHEVRLLDIRQGQDRSGANWLNHQPQGLLGERRVDDHRRPGLQTRH